MDSLVAHYYFYLVPLYLHNCCLRPFIQNLEDWQGDPHHIWPGRRQKVSILCLCGCILLRSRRTFFFWPPVRCRVDYLATPVAVTGTAALLSLSLLLFLAENSRFFPICYQALSWESCQWIRKKEWASVDNGKNDVITYFDLASRGLESKNVYSDNVYIVPDQSKH